MTEYEKMLAGQLYDCGDPELLALWHRCKQLILRYNQTPTDNQEQKDQLLGQILGSRGEKLWITPPFYADYGVNIHFGNNCEINMNCTFLDCNRITIGDNALIAPNVQIYTAYHPTHFLDRNVVDTEGNFSFCRTMTAPVLIGDNVWIGGGAILMPGVEIGDNVVIGAGSVVTKSIASNTIAVGNPCRIVRQNLRHQG